MKKALLLYALTLSTFASIAQVGLQIGAIGGPQATWLINRNDASDPKKKNKFDVRGFVGATVDYHFMPMLGVGLELVYSWQGQNYKVGPGPSSADVTPYAKNANYFKIPVVVNFNTDPDNLIMFMAKLGPELGINTAARIVNPNAATNTAPSGPWNVPNGANIGSQFQKITAGVLLGAGVGVNIIKDKLIATAGIRIDATFSNPVIGSPSRDIFSYYDASTSDHIGASRSRTWELATGIELGIKYIIQVGHKSTCPTFDEHAGEKALKGSSGKARLQIIPKEMRKK